MFGKYSLTVETKTAREILAARIRMTRASSSSVVLTDKVIWMAPSKVSEGSRDGSG